MQIQQEKAWSRAMPSAREMVDTRGGRGGGGGGGGGGVCPTKNLNDLSCTVHPKAGCQADDQYRLLFKTLGMDRCETGTTTPPECLLSVYQMGVV